MSNGTSSPLAGIKLSAGSATSRLTYNNFTLVENAEYTQNQLLLSSTYGVDPNCPYFYCFTNSGLVLDTTGAALLTTFTFTNGGSIQSVSYLYWGDDAALDRELSAPIVTLQVGGSGSLYILGHDPVSQACGYSIPGTDSTGLGIRWTSLADQVLVNTYWLFAGQYTTESNSIIHGILQQPWS
jgi:hypothetical protein